MDKVKTFEGTLSIFNKAGTVDLRKVESGGYLMNTEAKIDESAQLLTDMLEAKLPIPSYTLWLEGLDKPTETIIKTGLFNRKGEEVKIPTYTSAAVAKLVAGNTIELLACKRRAGANTFYAPVFKITAGTKAKTKAVKVTSVARIGR